MHDYAHEAKISPVFIVNSLSPPAHLQKTTDLLSVTIVFIFQNSTLIWEQFRQAVWVQIPYESSVMQAGWAIISEDLPEARIQFQVHSYGYCQEVSVPCHMHLSRVILYICFSSITSDPRRKFIQERSHSVFYNKTQNFYVLTSAIVQGSHRPTPVKCGTGQQRVKIL